MIEVNDVKEFSLEFDNEDGDSCSLSMAEWANGNGFTVTFFEGVNTETFNATNEMLDAIMNMHVYATTFKEECSSIEED